MDILEKDCNIRKEEILAKNRSSKKDEGVEHATLKGHRITEYTIFVIIVPMIIFAWLYGELAVCMALGAVANAYALGVYFALYRFTKRKLHLVMLILTLAALVVCIIVFVFAIFSGNLAPNHFGLGILL
ncbi:MAG: DUF6442 family protein [Oscillospiraceae bacterium]|nr:DUF6442 family protein [Oscillospiraceae bacterium]